MGFFLLMIVIVVIVVVLVARARRNSATSPVAVRTNATDAGQHEDLPTFDVVALGVAGSGKTVFLASMFHELQVQRAGRPYILEANMQDRVRLNAIYRQVRDASAPWPLGTKVDETRQFNFTCATLADGAKHGVMQVRYIDYAGELFEMAHADIEDDQARLEAHITSAHALIGVIDGYRVLQFLHGNPDGRRYLDGQIQPMIGLLAAATCPIHFVVTKWDVVRGFGEPPYATDEQRLAQVREALMAHSAIGHLVHATNTASRIIRLIPVSAVGPDFVQADEHGAMHKQPDARISPTNVDVPFASIIPDLFHHVQESITATDRRALEQYVRHAARLDGRELIAAVAKVISMPARFVLESTLGKAYGAHAVGLFLDWLGHPIDEKSARLGKLRADREQQMADAQTLRASVVRAFEDAVLMLEARMPSSNLSRSVDHARR